MRLRLGFENRTLASALAGQLIKLAAAPVGKKADQAQTATAAGPAAPAARAASRRCPRKTTIAIQTKLNALGYKLKPTRKAKDGVDGAFGGDTYAKLKLALGKGAGRNKFVASRNCKKLLALLQKAKPFAGAAPKATTAGPAASKMKDAPIDPLGAPGLRIREIVQGLMDDFPTAIPGNKLDPERKRVEGIVMKALRNELKNNRSKYMIDDKNFSKLKIAAKARQLIGANTQTQANV